jgi:hypothetical protein
MTRSFLRSPIPLAEAVEEPGGVAGFGVRPGRADRPMPNGVALLRRNLGHAVVDVAAEGPGEPAPAHPLRHVLPAQPFVGGDAEVRPAFALVAWDVRAPQPIQDLAGPSHFQQALGDVDRPRVGIVDRDDGFGQGGVEPADLERRGDLAGHGPPGHQASPSRPPGPAERFIAIPFMKASQRVIPEIQVDLHIT